MISVIIKSKKKFNNFMDPFFVAWTHSRGGNQGEHIPNHSFIFPTYYFTFQMMSHTFCFSLVTPALEIGLSAPPANRIITPHVALEAKERLSIMTLALDIRLSAPPTNWGIKPCVALEAEECTFVNFLDTAEKSTEESAKESEPNPAQPT